MTNVLWQRRHYTEAEYHLLPETVQQSLIERGIMRPPAEPEKEQRKQETDLFPDGFPHAAILQAYGLNYADVPKIEAELLKVDGIGPAKAKEIAAWFEGSD